MQVMRRARMQPRTGDRRDEPAYHTRSRVDQRSRQQGGDTWQEALLSGPGEIGKLRDLDGTSKVVSHDDDRFIPLMEKILDAQRFLTD